MEAIKSYLSLLMKENEQMYCCFDQKPLASLILVALSFFLCQHLFMAERSKNRCEIERLEKIIAKVEAKQTQEATLNHFEGFKVNAGYHKTRYSVFPPVNVTS